MINKLYARDHMFGGWLLNFYIAIQWLWLGLERHVWKISANKYKKSMKTRDLFAFQVKSTNLDNRKYATSLYLSKFWIGLQGLDRYDYITLEFTKIFTKVKEIVALQKRFQSFKIS